MPDMPPELYLPGFGLAGVAITALWAAWAHERKVRREDGVAQWALIGELKDAILKLAEGSEVFRVQVLEVFREVMDERRRRGRD